MNPTYEGHPLPRPRDEVVDQGLGAAGAALTACGTSSPATTSAASTTTTASTGEIPDETAGPYPGDGSNGPDVLEQSGVVRADIRSGFDTGSGTAEGVPMTLELVVADLAKGGSPTPAAARADRRRRASSRA